jgi:Bacterial Ig-like domain (group 3)
VKSTSAVLSQVVNAGLTATTTTIASSVNPSTVGQLVTFTATVTPASGTTVPTGTVTFLDGTTTLGTGTLNNTGKATLATSALTQGTHSITASYGGSSTFAASTSSALSQMVNTVSVVSTTTTLASSANPSTAGQSVTFTATVTPASGTTVPTGTVTFLDGTTTLGTGTLGNTGKATLATSALTQGTHSITASYGGDLSFAASTSSALSQVVNAALSVVSVTPSSGSGISQTFQYLFSDASGATAIKSVRTLIGTGTANAGSCQFMYDVASNMLSVMKDDGSGWGSSQLLGVSGSIGNSQCSVNTGVSNAILSGNYLTLNLATTFTPSFAGTRSIYMLAVDVTGFSTGFKSKGTWTTANIVAQAPSPVSVTPNSGSGTSQTFQYVFSDVNGAWYIKSLRVLINATTSNVSACEFYYTVGNNSLQAMKDDGSTWGTAQVLGTVGSVGNSQCSVNTAVSSAVKSGNNITLNLAITFASGFTGTKNIYMQAYDIGGLTSGFVLEGTWTTGP